MGSRLLATRQQPSPSPVQCPNLDDSDDGRTAAAAAAAAAAMAVPLIVYLAAAAVVYGVVKLVRTRLFYRNLPKPPGHSLLWGHLKLFGEISKKFPPNVHPMVVVTYMRRAYDLPEVFYIDMWPAGPPIMACCSPDAAAQVTQVQVLGKHPFNAVVLDPLVGTDSIPVVDGPRWKFLHRMIAPAFKPANARALVGTAAGQGLVFARDVLAPLAATGDAFSMEAAVSRLVFEVIARSLMGVPFDSQRDGPRGLDRPSTVDDQLAVLESRRKSDDADETSAAAWEDEQKRSMLADIQFPPLAQQVETAWLANPLRRLRLRSARLAALRRSGAWIRRRTLARYREVRDQGLVVPETVLDSCLMERVALEKEAAASASSSSSSKAQAAAATSTPPPPPPVCPLPQDESWLHLFETNMRALIFGAQGTTTDTLCFVYMMLSCYPAVMARMRAEHDAVCGATPGTIDDAARLLRDEPHRTAELAYTTAVIKETLRMFPVGFVVRHDDKNADGLMEINGKKYPTKGQMVTPATHTVHHDPAAYPDPMTFRPERWLSADDPPPRNAFRAFERGPRACMGREVAMDEMRAVLLLTARWFDFETAGPGANAKPRVPEVTTLDADTPLGDWAFQELIMEARPRGGAMMRVSRTERPL
ncbi:hypothetical protein RB598_004539 [Gaeumannomyces tritici]